MLHIKIPHNHICSYSHDDTYGKTNHLLLCCVLGSWQNYQSRYHCMLTGTPAIMLVVNLVYAVIRLWSWLCVRKMPRRI
ncbi:hypothetical protein TsFJ059_002836 [Trichoderma semiorbis]|uniref:Uncharacterized protein n=1 Tax=Trichoderma semiorbis TaxID=1491008 RepID=A0A9P8KQR6_9HYPO|nr:hypothetical protein TsFJ059_002836 [Trichoderma semiorbis]